MLWKLRIQNWCDLDLSDAWETHNQLQLQQLQQPANLTLQQATSDFKLREHNIFKQPPVPTVFGVRLLQAPV